MTIDKEVLAKAQKDFIKARLSLMSTRPFYAHLCMKMAVEWQEFGQPGGAPGVTKTDGKTLFINPEMFVRFDKKEQVSLLVHEVLHCAAGHLFRCGSRDAVRWNVAGDVYIANLLASEGLEQVKGTAEFFRSIGVRPEDYRALMTEEIYDKMPQSKQNQSGQGKGCGHDHWNGSGCYEEAQSASERSEGAAQWKQNVIEASQAAGKEKGAWDELVQAALPKPPFHLRIFEYLNKGMGGDTTFDSFNRRFVWQGMYLPTETKQVMGEIAVAVDTSGSMSSEQLSLALGYIRAFREQHPCKLHLIQCDYDAVSEGQYQVYDEYERLPQEFKVVGRGGTSFDPPFKLMRERRIEPKVLIYLTDGYGHCSEKAPSYPVLWCILKGDREWKQPFGEKVVVE